ncbi:pseudouridine synthase [Hoyosella sp. YIM 151337]|uniref:pseudouridine synthase n=1 Tax=Hoyosella sp. YIM 151337 TaxID=2992742 RepID=UPI00223675ED|nr:pseudouridine synthase [Hoyosella sp. YIM 151337]MCW4352326.1 pseudouridine synthase [Hoyosella sp. YIM 151337]
MRADGGPPLPVRDGLGPARVRIEPGSQATTMFEYLTERFPGTGEFWVGESSRGHVVDQHGRELSAATPYRPGRIVYYYREPAPEPRVPFELTVLHRDENLVAVDKPHFLATIPRGQHVVETALVRARRQTGNMNLSPAHRLDRMTAGVLVFVAQPTLRQAYQELFAQRAVTKTYEAIALHDPAVATPVTVRSRIVKQSGVMVAREVPGEPNSETHIDLAEVRDRYARYALRPVTGKTHQLRLHMASLGLPIRGDNYYPAYRPAARDDFGDPLRLLAREIAFTDPVTGEPRRFRSSQDLEFPGG